MSPTVLYFVCSIERVGCQSSLSVSPCMADAATARNIHTRSERVVMERIANPIIASEKSAVSTPPTRRARGRSIVLVIGFSFLCRCPYTIERKVVNLPIFIYSVIKDKIVYTDRCV